MNKKGKWRKTKCKECGTKFVCRHENCRHSSTDREGCFCKECSKDMSIQCEYDEGEKVEFT